ncbi:hypothetical protein DFH07DRAFT_942742 [Mycena maculata]|uniref:Uncharacterized protein n=1 Tax=Mycena maculata TaxID=230809 RepID=A0AAD7ILK1_9AGAR|nr:hypothetical protein DFH07DRAFT_942742 [Mycena maculata]
MYGSVDMICGVRSVIGPSMRICHPKCCVPNAQTTSKLLFFWPAAFWSEIQEFLNCGAEKWINRNGFSELREARDSKSLDHHGVTPVTSCFFHTASIVEAGFLDIQPPLTLQATTGGLTWSRSGSIPLKELPKLLCKSELVPGYILAPSARQGFNGHQTPPRIAHGQLPLDVYDHRCYERGLMLFQAVFLVNGILQAVLPDDTAHKVNPFPLVLAADAPHGLVEALDAHTRKHAPAPLPLDRQRCASDQAGSSERSGSRPAWVDNSRLHSRSRSRIPGPRMPTNVSTPILGLGPQIWLLLGTGQERRELLLSLESIGDDAAWRLRTTSLVAWHKGGRTSSLHHCTLSPHLAPGLARILQDLYSSVVMFLYASWVNATGVKFEPFISPYVVYSEPNSVYTRKDAAELLPPKSELSKLVNQSGTLFIYAATAIRYIMDGGALYKTRLADLTEDNSKRNQMDDIDDQISAESDGLIECYGIADRDPKRGDINFLLIGQLISLALAISRRFLHRFTTLRACSNPHTQAFRLRRSWPALGWTTPPNTLGKSTTCVVAQSCRHHRHSRHRYAIGLERYTGLPDIQSFVMKVILKFHPSSDSSRGHYLKPQIFGQADRQIFWGSCQHLGTELGIQGTFSSCGSNLEDPHLVRST